MVRRVVSIAGLTWAGFLAGEASLGAQANPREVARRYFAALAAERWDTAAALVDPASQRQLQDATVSFIIFVAGHLQELRQITVGAGSGGLTGYGVEIAPTADSLDKYGAWRVPVYSGSPTIKELASMPPVEFLARTYPASRLRCFDGDCFTYEDPRPRNLIRTTIDNESKARVIYRRERVESRDFQAREEEDVLNLVRRGTVWRVELPQGPPVSPFSLIDAKMGLQPPR